MEKIIDIVKKLIAGLSWIGPLLAVYPRWAQMLFILTGSLCAASLLVFLVYFSSASKELDPFRRTRLPKIPYPSFQTDFREVLPPYRVATNESYLHVVWGNLADIRDTSVVLPLNQRF